MGKNCSKCEIELTVLDSIYYDMPAGSGNSFCQKCYDESTTPISVQEHIHVESIDCLCEKLDGVKFELNTPERIALFKHLQKLSAALKEIEGDNEPEAIMAAIGNRGILSSSIEEAKFLRDHLLKLIEALES